MMGAAELQASHDGTTRAASWWRAWWPEIAIVALAALVRFWRLDYHSFWFDEAVSLDWAEDNPAFIWANTFPLLNDKHPPAYYLLLHYWQKGLALFGLEHSDVALRSLGAILAVAVRAAYLASETLGLVWALTDRRVILPDGQRSVMLLELDTARPLLGDVQLITKSGDKHLLKHLAQPRAVVAQILEARERRSKRRG